MMEIPIIQKPVHWLAEKINHLLGGMIWEMIWLEENQWSPRIFNGTAWLLDCYSLRFIHLRKSIVKHMLLEVLCYIFFTEVLPPWYYKRNNWSNDATNLSTFGSTIEFFTEGLFLFERQTTSHRSKTNFSKIPQYRQENNWKKYWEYLVIQNIILQKLEMENIFHGSIPSSKKVTKN